MASIEDIYKKSDFAKLGKNLKDKTPISADGGIDILKDGPKLEKARGGKLNLTPYSYTINP
jgi:hypothetical protein